MGHRPPPFDPEFGADCGVFAGGKTPRQFIAFFSEIEYCDDIWPEGLPRPPSSLTLTQTFLHHCQWEGFDGRWSSLLSLSIFDASSLTLVFDDLFYVFDASEIPLSYGFSNDSPGCVLPFFFGHGGAAHVLARAETTAPSLSKLCVLAGVPTDIDTKCNVLPIDKDEGWIRFFRPGLRIKTSMKYTLTDIF